MTNRRTQLPLGVVADGQRFEDALSG